MISEWNHERPEELTIFGTAVVVDFVAEVVVVVVDLAAIVAAEVVEAVVVAAACLQFVAFSPVLADIVVADIRILDTGRQIVRVDRFCHCSFVDARYR